MITQENITKPERHSVRRAASHRFPFCTDACDSTMAFLDVPDVMRALKSATGIRATSIGSEIDLIALRIWLFDRFQIGKSICVENRQGVGLFQHICKLDALHSGWQWVSISRPMLGRGVPLSAGYITAALECLRFESASTPVHTVIVIGHSEMYAESVARLLRAGVHVIMVGLIECFADKLIELIDHARCDLLDLEFDAQAVKLPNRLLFEDVRIAC